MPVAPAAEPFKQESLFEYHLYTLQRPTDLLDRETKQVTLLEAHGVKLTNQLEFRGSSSWYTGAYRELPQNQKVGVFVELDNSEKERPRDAAAERHAARLQGRPKRRPAVRRRKGRDRSHAARQKLHVKLGEAFDVVGDRKQTEYKALGNCTSESAWEIELRNHKDSAVTVSII